MNCVLWYIPRAYNAHMANSANDMHYLGSDWKTAERWYANVHTTEYQSVHHGIVCKIVSLH